MSYVPNSTDIYTAAFSGCVSGITTQRRLSSSAAGSYNDMMRVADAFAQEVDGLWVGTANWLDVELIWLVSCGEFANRFPNPLTDISSVLTSTYTEVAKAIMAVIDAAHTRYAFEGITAPPLGGGGWKGLVPVVTAAGIDVDLTALQAASAIIQCNTGTIDQGPSGTLGFPIPASDAEARCCIVRNTNANDLTLFLGGVSSGLVIGKNTSAIITIELTQITLAVTGA